MNKYSDALGYLYDLEKYGIVFGLENIKWILNLIGNPHKKLRTVHIGGTNGKGSVASMLSHIFIEGGYRVGKYTSPHLVSFTERITVNEEEIREDEVADLTSFIREKIEHEDNKRFFTFFDFTTAMAFEYFYRKGTDMAIVEVGLGGRLDSTNVLEPLACIITNVGLDHMEYLGNSITDIAREKAGIIKNGVPVITAAEGSAGKVIEETAAHLGSAIYELGRDFTFEKQREQQMSYRGPVKQFDGIFVNLKGDHQFINASLALCATEVISALGLDVNDKSIHSGLSHAVWKGRLEIVREKPTIILDGAHNHSGMLALSVFLKTYYPDKNKILIFGVMKDKEYGKMLNEIVPLANSVIFTRPEMDRALTPEQLKQSVHPGNPGIGSGAQPPDSSTIFYTRDVKSALLKAKEIAEDNDLILITGSLYTIGEAKQIIYDIF